MLTLVIGNKNLSSWSLRPWLVLRHLALPFREIKLALDTPDFKAAVRRYSGAERVPVLMDGELAIWDSLAIAEYANEKAQGRGWPPDAALRAQARSISAEMHSGFAALRHCWPMKAVERLAVPLSSTAAADVARIDAIWQTCLGKNGPWLCGEYSIADAMYAPVVLRFNTYGAQLSAAAAGYVRQVLDEPHLREWLREAQQEVAA